MKKIFMMSLVALMIGVSACNSQKSKQNNADKVAGAQTPQNSISWEGIYTGTLPCADCSGIQTKIELKKDLTYKMSTVYLGKSDEPETIESTGKFMWSENGDIIVLDNAKENGTATQYLVAEKTLTQLDAAGNVITGELADKYILRKVDMNLVEKYWKLIEIYGEPVNAETGNAKEAHVILKIDGNRVNGNGGCNSFFGTYKLGVGDRISFSQMGSTQMMCMNMKTETQMKQVFETADSYLVKNDTLILNRARMAPLARFERVLME